MAATDIVLSRRKSVVIGTGLAIVFITIGWVSSRWFHCDAVVTVGPRPPPNISTKSAPCTQITERDMRYWPQSNVNAARKERRTQPTGFVAFAGGSSQFNNKRQAFMAAVWIAYLSNRAVLIPDDLFDSFNHAIEIDELSLIVPIVKVSSVDPSVYARRLILGFSEYHPTFVYEHCPEEAPGITKLFQQTRTQALCVAEAARFWPEVVEQNEYYFYRRYGFRMRYSTHLQLAVLERDFIHFSSKLVSLASHIVSRLTSPTSCYIGLHMREGDFHHYKQKAFLNPTDEIIQIIASTARTAPCALAVYISSPAFNEAADSPSGKRITAVLNGLRGLNIPTRRFNDFEHLFDMSAANNNNNNNNNERSKSKSTDKPILSPRDIPFIEQIVLLHSRRFIPTIGSTFSDTIVMSRHALSVSGVGLGSGIDRSIVDDEMLWWDVQMNYASKDAPLMASQIFPVTFLPE